MCSSSADERSFLCPKHAAVVEPEGKTDEDAEDDEAEIDAEDDEERMAALRGSPDETKIRRKRFSDYTPEAQIKEELAALKLNWRNQRDQRKPKLVRPRHNFDHSIQNLVFRGATSIIQSKSSFESEWNIFVDKVTEEDLFDELLQYVDENGTDR